MAKNKQPPRALFAVKHDFVAAIDNVSQTGIMLIQSVDQALELKAVDQKIAPILRERLDAFRKSLSQED